MTGHKMPFMHLTQFRFHLAAHSLTQIAAALKRTALRQVQRAGNIAF